MKNPHKLHLTADIYLNSLMYIQTLYCITEMEMRLMQELLGDLKGWWERWLLCCDWGKHKKHCIVWERHLPSLGASGAVFCRR